MADYIYSFLIVNIAMLICGPVFAREPHCSKFHYEEQMLEKIIRMEIKVEEMVKDMKTKEEAMQAAADSIDEKMADFKSRLESVCDDLSTRVITVPKKKENQPPVAFNVYEAKDKYVKPDNTFMFSHTMLNLGEAYDIQTGKFTAPVTGVYLFSVYICTQKDKYGNFAIEKTSSVILKGIHHEDNYGSCASGTVITDLQKAEQVWVKATTGGSMLLEEPRRQNMFSGSLIHMAS